MSFRRAFVIQCKSTGEFLTPKGFFAKSLDRAGRVYDIQEAIDTAQMALSDGDYTISKIWEGEPDNE